MIITRAEDGAASIITPVFASPRTDSWSPKWRPFPPQDILAPGAARDLPFPPVIDPEVLPLRSQRHVPNSIATLRIRLARTLLRALPRPPCPTLLLIVELRSTRGRDQVKRYKDRHQ